ncbi:hypothetical protein [Bradyrhizobium sp. HKCCYLS20291]|uniref:hypothetical protein n=1 Tax=Bradyrhizobium sp. HKCCYLS20291 TaxID=3420766 RepID=UPI003EBCF6D9
MSRPDDEMFEETRRWLRCGRRLWIAHDLQMLELQTLGAESILIFRCRNCARIRASLAGYTWPGILHERADKLLTRGDGKSSARVRDDPGPEQPSHGCLLMRRSILRKPLMLAAVTAGLTMAGLGTVSVARADVVGTPTLAPLAQAQPGVAQLAARHAQADELQYEPSKRDREGDDDTEDEPRH